jgi:hypothetical protein
MAFAYAATGASTFFLQRKSTKAHFSFRSLFIPILGVIFSVYLITQCSFSQITLGLILLFVGVPIYIKYSPKKEIAELKEALISPESILKSAHAQEDRFLAHVLKHIKNFYRKRIGKKQAQDSTNQVQA